MLTQDDIHQAFAVLAASGLRAPDAWDSPEALERAMQAWAQVLADLRPLELQTAIVSYLRSPDCRFWPMPGQLLAQVRPTDADDADSAWGDLCAGHRRWGFYRPPALAESAGEWALDPDDARAAAMACGLAALGGWTQFALRSDDDNTAMRASFRAAYRAHRQRRQHEAQAQMSAAILGATGFADFGRPALPAPPVKPSPPQLATVGGVTLTPEERVERMREYEARKEERRAQLREIGRAMKDAKREDA